MHCTTSIGWYIGKFTVSLCMILFVYEGFLKEKPILCVCGAGAREYARQKNGQERQKGRCICKHWRKAIYPCGCKRKILFDECAKTNLSAPPSPDDSKKLQKPSCCCGD